MKEKDEDADGDNLAFNTNEKIFYSDSEQQMHQGRWMDTCYCSWDRYLHRWASRILKVAQPQPAS
jgi:hypothetical protein